MRLHYDSVVTTPGAFNGGGYQEARLDLTVMAMLFAVVHEHRAKDLRLLLRQLQTEIIFRVAGAGDRYAGLMKPGCQNEERIVNDVVVGFR